MMIRVGNAQLGGDNVDQGRQCLSGWAMLIRVGNDDQGRQ